jgi:hypothetical protein
MPKVSEIFDIKPVDKLVTDKDEPAKKPRKKREFTEEQKNVLRERLKLGREKMAANRAAKKDAEPSADSGVKTKTEEPSKLEIKKMETKVAAAIDTPTSDKEVKVITKYLLELDDGDDMDPKELKAFIKTLYKASKSNIVREAQAAAARPPPPKPKAEPANDDSLFNGDEEIPRRPANTQPSKPMTHVESPKPQPVVPKVSKEEQMRIAALAKVKATLAAKKRR